jgi:hypothetical protein
MLSYRSTRSLPNFKSRRTIRVWIPASDALRSPDFACDRPVERASLARPTLSAGIKTDHKLRRAGCTLPRPRTLPRRVLEYWSVGTLHCVRIAPLVLFILLCLSVSTIARAEPVIILDPYFYRTPVSEAIDGSAKTSLGDYDETDGKVTPPPNPPRLTISELHTLAVAYAQSILKQTSPKIIRDRHGVIVAIRIENQDPAFSSVLLTPGFTERFENLLGKDCLVCVPNRQTVFLFPRLGSNMEQFSIPLRGIYHNSVWPVSTELFEWRGGALHAIRDFEPN